MKDKDTNVTVGFVAREKFSVAVKSLEALYKFADIPFRLIVIDCGTPGKFANKIDAFLEPHDNYEIVRVDRFLQANGQKQMVIDRSGDGYILLLENDTVFTRGRLSALLDACVAYEGRCLVIPALYETHRMRRRFHHDNKFGRIEAVSQNGEVHRTIAPDRDIVGLDAGPKTRRIVRSAEAHVYMCHKKVMDEIGGLDTTINTREHYDLCIALDNAQIPIVLEPKVEADFVAAPPVGKEEAPFFLFSWDPEVGRRSVERIKRKWNVPDLPDSSEHFMYQRQKTSRFSWYFYRLSRRVFG